MTYLSTLTLERSSRVDTSSAMLTRRPFRALVDVLGTVGAVEAVWTTARVGAGHGVSVTPCPWVARVARTRVVQVAEQARLAGRTLAHIAADTVNTRSTIHARLLNTIVLVDLAVLADVAVDADALVAALRVLTGAMVLTRIVARALIHVLGAVPALPVGRALA